MGAYYRIRHRRGFLWNHFFQSHRLCNFGKKFNGGIYGTRLTHLHQLYASMRLNRIGMHRYFHGRPIPLPTAPALDWPISPTIPMSITPQISHSPLCTALSPLPSPPSLSHLLLQVLHKVHKSPPTVPSRIQ